MRKSFDGDEYPVMNCELLMDSSSLSSIEKRYSLAGCVKKENQGGRVRLAIISGIFATVGSLFGKFAGWVGVDSIIKLLLKGILVILMILGNTMGCTFFVKALNASGSSLPCTIASAATSYICSVLAGCLIFNESTSICWWCGIFFVILGLLLISQDPSKNDPALSTKKSKEE